MTTRGSTIRVCPNASCRLGMPQPYEIDLHLYPGVDKCCPRCGTPWKARPDWKGPPPDDYKEEEIS